MSNVACRIFEEQIKLLLSLPNQEEAKTILYQAIKESYSNFKNQIDFQNDNQNDDRNGNQCFLFLNQVSELSINIFKLLLKSICWKEFSENYGGKRERSGRKKSSLPTHTPENDKVNPPKDDCPPKNESYKWRGAVIKLNDKDFTTWLNKYSKINVRRVLEDRDDWLATQPERIQKNWYMSTVKWLEKLNNEAV